MRGEVREGREGWKIVRAGDCVIKGERNTNGGRVGGGD